MEVRISGDGTMRLILWETDESPVLYHLVRPGQTRLIGRIPRAVERVSFSEDFRRAVVGTREYFGDVWGMEVR